MFHFAQCLSPQSVRAGLTVANKKGVFQQLAAIATQAHHIESSTVLERLVERERLGSTGFGGGIAIPHGKIEGLTSIVGVLVRLSTAIDFEAIDDLPVDLVFMLLSPTDGGADHLKALAHVSRMMRDQDFVAKLRGAATNDALFALLSSYDQSAVA